MVLIPSPAFGQDFSMRVATDDRHDWNKEPSLKIIAEPGTADYREIILTNGSNQSINLNLGIANSKTTDGVISIDDESEATAAPFLKFSENPVSIAAGSVKTVRISLDTPADINPFTESPYLLVSTQALTPKAASDGQIRAVLPIVNRVAYPIFIGVGDYSDFETNFTIDKIEFHTTPAGNAAKLWIQNDGKLDLPVSGFIKFQDAAFAGQIYGPFNFDSSAVLPNSSAFVSILLPEEIIESEWRIFTQVESNDQVKTKIFVENISFSSFSFFNLLVFLLVFILSIATLVWSLRQFRTREIKPKRPKVVKVKAKSELEPQLDTRTTQWLQQVDELLKNFDTQSPDYGASETAPTEELSAKPKRKKAPAKKPTVTSFSEHD